MWDSRRHLPQNESGVVAADAAGLALACAYSSSDEYAADVIRNRRAAGAYGASSYHREFAMIAASFAVLTLIYLIH